MTKKPVQKPQAHILVIEPNTDLVSDSGFKNPYSELNSYSSQITILNSIESGLYFLSSTTPDLVLLSCSFTPQKNHKFLEALKNHITAKIIPLVFVIDLSQATSVVLGTSWGNSLGVIHTASTPQEIKLLLKRWL